MAEEIVVTPEVTEKILTDVGNAPEVPAKEGTLLDTAGEVEKVASEAAAKAEALKNETPEQKTAREATEAEAAKAKTVPDKYDFKVPEGMTLDTVMVEKLSPVLKELGITQEGAQKLVNAYAPVIKEQVETQQKAAIDLWEKQSNDWKAESIKMMGANAKTDMVFAAKFMDRFGGESVKGEDGKQTNQLRVLLAETRLGNNPVLLKAIVAAGRLLGEDSLPKGTDTGKGNSVSLYDHPTSKATLT